MKRSSVKRAGVMVLVLAGLAVFTVRRQADGAGTVHANSPASTQDAGAWHPRWFSRTYEICAEDSEGRPLVVHQKELVFFLPQSPPELEDRTFILTKQCR